MQFIQLPNDQNSHIGNEGNNASSRLQQLSRKQEAKKKKNQSQSLMSNNNSAEIPKSSAQASDNPQR